MFSYINLLIDFNNKEYEKVYRGMLISRTGLNKKSELTTANSLLYYNKMNCY